MKENDRISREFEVLLLDNRNYEVSGNTKTLTYWAQETLNILINAGLPLSGQLDEATKSALKAFQVKQGLSATGKVTPQTERRLMEERALKSGGILNPALVNSIVQSARTKIEDWTDRATPPKDENAHLVTSDYRNLKHVWALVLHHMAFKRRNAKKEYSDPERYLQTRAHFCIMFDGKIIQLYPISRKIWHSNCTSPGSVGVEFEGNFPNTEGKWWYPRDKVTKKITARDEDHPTKAQIEAGRFLIQYLQKVAGFKEVLAHSQSSDGRTNDPGPDIWYNVGQWSVNTLGIGDGGPGFKCGTGSPIPQAWRHWHDKNLVNGVVPVAAPHINGPNNPPDFGPSTAEARTDMELINRLVRVVPISVVKLSPTVAQINAVLQQGGNADKLADVLFYAVYDDAPKPLTPNHALAGAWKTIKGKVQQVLRGDIATGQTSSTSIGKLGRLIVNTDIPALSKAISIYQFTPEDALWLARFVEGEAGGRNDMDNHAVIWAMFNRYGAFRHLASWGNFGDFIQLYSTTLQPILKSVDAAQRVWDNHYKNPQKFPVVVGDGFYEGTNIRKVQYKKHVDLQKKTWPQFNSVVQNMVIEILRGKIPNPGIGMASDFASTKILFTKKYGRPPSQMEWVEFTKKHKAAKATWIGEVPNINQMKNAFFLDNRLRSTPLNSIKVQTQ